MGDNQLSSTISNEIGQTMGFLKKISLCDNSVTSLISTSLGTLKKFSTMHLYKNTLSSQIPLELRKSKSLWDLRLFINNFNGHILLGFDNLTHLKILTLRENKLISLMPQNVCLIGGLWIESSHFIPTIS